MSNPFIHQTISNGNSDVKANLTNNLQSLKYKIDLYIAQKNIEIYDKNIFINEINKIYLEAYEKLNEKITPIKNGIYEIEACRCGKVFDVYGAFMEDNVRIQIYDKVSVLNQRFEVIYEPKYDGYIIKALHSNKYLSVSVNPNDINVQQQTIKNDRSNQLWNITKTKTNNYKLQSKYNGKFIDINSAGSANGTQVIKWEKNNGLWQEFRFNLIEIFPQENKKELTNHETRQGNLEYFNENRPIQNGIYLIEACHCNNKVLDVYDAFQEENALIQLYDKNGGANQIFEVIYDYKKKGYTLKALHSNK